jgi:hypothetical protein
MRGTYKKSPCIVSFTDLVPDSEMIFSESIFTIFMASAVFKGRWVSSRKVIKIKIELPYENLACLN